MAGLFTQLQGVWLVNMISWFSLGFDDFCIIKDINAEHESCFCLHCDTGLVYPMQRSRDLVWKTTLGISLSIQMVSHQNGEPSCQILFRTTWILCADSIYQSKFYLEAAWTHPSILLALCLGARMHPPILGRERGPWGAAMGIVVHLGLRGLLHDAVWYRVLDLWVLSYLGI